MSLAVAKLNRAARSPASLARRATQNPSWIPALLRGIESSETRTRFGCAKTLVILSEQRPERLYPYLQTRECRHVAIGHALLALGEILDLLSDPAPVRRFAQRHRKNPRAATRKKAERLLRRASQYAHTQSA